MLPLEIESRIMKSCFLIIVALCTRVCHADVSENFVWANHFIPDKNSACWEAQFEGMYSQGVALFMKGNYEQSEAIFSVILDSAEASEEIRGAALWDF